VTRIESACLTEAPSLSSINPQSYNQPAPKFIILRTFSLFRELSDITDAVSTPECHNFLKKACCFSRLAAHREISRDVWSYLGETFEAFI